MPQRRMTAQEICYHRIQNAQQQAAQLAAAVKAAASTNPNLGLSGEKRRVAHRPNAFLPSSNPGMRGPTFSYRRIKCQELKTRFFFVGLTDASSRVLSPTRVVTDQLSVKAHTSAGILSKTVSTTAQKRMAHTPTMKVTSPYNRTTMVYLNVPNKHSVFSAHHRALPWSVLLFLQNLGPRCPLMSASVT